jgi:hypothetical protein
MSDFDEIQRESDRKRPDLPVGLNLLGIRADVIVTKKIDKILIMFKVRKIFLHNIEQTKINSLILG